MKFQSKQVTPTFFKADPCNCRGGPPWPPVGGTRADEATGGHGGPPLQLCARALLLFVLLAFLALPAMSQSGYTLWGDVKVDDSKAENPGPSSLTIVLYDQSTRIVGRQTIGGRGRYRFTNLRAGEYDLAIETTAGEITRQRLIITGTTSDIRQDFEFEWRERPGGRSNTAGVISAADFYSRSAANNSL